MIAPFLHIKAIAFIVLTMLLNVQCSHMRFDAGPVRHIPRKPVISPDYSDITIPPKIAPLNFRAVEKAKYYCARMYAPHGDTLYIDSKTGAFRIPPRAWKKLLLANRGDSLSIVLYGKDTVASWFQYDAITMHVSKDTIDRYCAYRLIDPLYKLWDNMGIYQRDLQSFEQTTVLENATLVNVSPEKSDEPVSKSCVNCHSFYNKNSNKMIIHTRGGSGTGMIIINNDSIIKVDTKTAFNKSPGAYAAWHPDGNLIALTVMSVHQFFHAVRRTRDVIDTRSDLVLYDIARNTISTCKAIADPAQMETFPEWSPDGRYLYFCSTPMPDSSFTIYNDTAYATIRYSLKRIRFDQKTREWGKLETVLSDTEANHSIILPKISPDGRFLLFCEAHYGNFPIHAPESDLYLMDLATFKYSKLWINSDFTESYHSWSSNGRWIVFSSKRDSSTCARPYFCHIDSLGRVSKPFILPQKDPDFYSSFYKTYNIPELVATPIKDHWRKLYEVAQGKRGIRKAVFEK